jgi:hypothetical protein
MKSSAPNNENQENQGCVFLMSAMQIKQQSQMQTLQAAAKSNKS